MLDWGSLVGWAHAVRAHGNGCHDLRWSHGTPQPLENGGQKNLPTLLGCMRGKGLGRLLMIALMDIARSKGLKIMEGEVLNKNSNMMKLMERLEFTAEAHPEDGSLILVRKILS